MTTTRVLRAGAIALGFTLVAAPVGIQARQQTGDTVRIDPDDIGGVVTGPRGAEAGVWVIAETADLPTRFVRIVVTDDRGRYVIPDLPKATYSVWTRGYGLVDSAKAEAKPGETVNLKAVVAPDPHSAAKYYPAGYWFSLLKPPAASEFPGTGPEGNGIAAGLKTQAEWLRLAKSGGCLSCHALGTPGTREIPAALGVFDSSVDAWMRRVQSGQAGANMMSTLNQLGAKRTLAVFADWTDRIKAGEVPPPPPRPQGLERNVVITEWDWADPKAYLHDEASTDRRNPTLNANGLIYGALELSADYLPVLDPVHNTISQVKLTVRDQATEPAQGSAMLQPSAYFGKDPPWSSRNNVHNPMFDEKGRVWITSAVRPPENPAFCKEGSDHPSAKLMPLQRSSRHLAVYDPKTQKLTHISTCFGTHHLMFAEDANHTLWTSGGGQVVGWLNRKMFDETGDEAASQGWTALVLDTNGNGKRDAYVEPNEPVDPAKDKRIVAGLYGISVNPADGSIWGSALGFPGAVVHLIPGANPPETTLTEYFEVPWDDAKAPVKGYSPSGMDIDKSGVVWMPLASGHFASFDRRKCEGPLSGPQANGKQCPEGWTLYPFPGPKLQNDAGSGSAEASYYAWVDQFNTLGLGADVPIATGNGAEGLLALVDGKFVTLRVPYPLGFYVKGMDGRIDDPNAGWKGRGVWTTDGTRTPFHREGGKGTKPKVIRFQLRPDPLAS